MRIVIETVDHKDQRYDTAGDWQTNTVARDGVVYMPCDLLIRVSRMADWRSEALVAVHELVEALLCKQYGITAAQVDAWDMPRSKSASEPLDYDEPGADPAAPYHRQHQIAEVIERALCEFFQLDWQRHTVAVGTCWEREYDPTIRALAARQQPWPDCIFEHVDGCPDDPDSHAKHPEIKKVWDADATYLEVWRKLPNQTCPTCKTMDPYGHEPGCVWVHETPWLDKPDVQGQMDEFNKHHCPTCGAEVPTIFEHVDGCPDEPMVNLKVVGPDGEKIENADDV